MGWFVGLEDAPRRKRMQANANNSRRDF